jgi:hypothetical protein
MLFIIYKLSEIVIDGFVKKLIFSYSKLIFTFQFEEVWTLNTLIWHFQLFQLFFLNIFYVNINILAKRILFGYEC